jgi:vitamin B12 transporter
VSPDRVPSAWWAVALLLLVSIPQLSAEPAAPSSASPPAAKPLATAAADASGQADPERVRGPARSEPVNGQADPETAGGQGQECPETARGQCKACPEAAGGQVGQGQASPEAARGRGGSQPATRSPSGHDSQAGSAPEKRLDLKEEIVVTANRLETPSESVGSSVTVIGREEIERRQEPFVLDLLRTVPGLEVNQSGGPGALANVFMRGADPTQTLVMIDGVPVNDTTGGGFDFSGLRSDNVDRIEVLRGPQSTLYGSEAMGGVISITTRRGGPGLHAELDARDGSRNGRELRLGADGSTAGFDYSLSVAGQRTDGPAEAGEAKTNPFSGANASARIGLGLPAGGRLELTLRHVDAKANLDSFVFGVGAVDAPEFEQRRRLSAGSLQFVQPVNASWKLRLTAGIDDERTRGTDVPENPADIYDFSSRHIELGAESDLKLGRQDTLIVGVSREGRRGMNAGSFDTSLAVDSLFAQDNWSWRDRLFLTAGLRHDHSSRFGDKTTYRMTGSCLWQGSWRLHGSLGTGFRGPTFDELFFPMAGNPKLRPETSQGADLGVERELRNGSVVADLTFFANRFRDLIDFDFASLTYANARRANAQGVEASLRLRPRTDLEIQGSYTYTATRDLATGLPLPRRPRDRWTLLAAFDRGARLRATLTLSAVAHRIDSDGSSMDSYQRADLSLEYRVRPWFAPYLTIQNLLDERYQEVSGYTTPRLWAFVGVRLRYSS